MSTTPEVTVHVLDRPQPRSSTALGPLVLASGTVRRAGVRERVDAAAAAGFDGIGLSAGAYAAARSEGWTPAGLRALLDDSAVALVEVEGLLGFSSTGAVTAGVLAGRRYADPAVVDDVLEMAAVLGAGHVCVNTAFEGELERGAPAALRALAQRAADVGLRIAVEAVPCSTLVDLPAALRLVQEADSPAVGLLVDSWHLYRGGASEEQVRAVPPGLVVAVQLDDGPRVPVLPDYLEDTLHHRDLPGEGELPLVAFLQTLLDHGVRAPVSVEVLSDRLDALPAMEAAERAARTARAVFAQVRP